MGLNKKLERSKQEGFDEGYEKGYQAAMREVVKDQRRVWMDGIRAGAENMNDNWIEVVDNIRGIGPTLKQRILDQIEENHQKRVASANESREEQHSGETGVGTEHQDSGVR